MRDGIPLQQAAAKAATRSADSLINAERPWIVPKITVEMSPSVTFVGGYDDGSESEPIRFSFASKTLGVPQLRF